MVRSSTPALMSYYQLIHPPPEPDPGTLRDPALLNKSEAPVPDNRGLPAICFVGSSHATWAPLAGRAAGGRLACRRRKY